MVERAHNMRFGAIDLDDERRVAVLRFQAKGDRSDGKGDVDILLVLPLGLNSKTPKSRNLHDYRFNVWRTISKLEKTIKPFQGGGLLRCSSENSSVVVGAICR
jgi:hypothetical protein